MSDNIKSMLRHRFILYILCILWEMQGKYNTSQNYFPLNYWCKKIVYDWELFHCLLVYSMYTIYIEVYAHTVSVSVLCIVLIKYHVGKVVFWPNCLYAPKFFAFQLPNISCRIIRTVQYFSNSNYNFYHECKQENKFDHALWIWQT